MSAGEGSLRVVGGLDPLGAAVVVEIAGGIQGPAPSDAPVLDARGLVVAPGLIDLQVNGAFGHDFTEDPASIWAVGARLPETGVTSFCPTIITSPPDRIDRARKAMSRRPADYGGAEPLGLHVEGPHLAPGKRGTHPERLLTPPSEATVTPEQVAIVTLAPELPGALELIRRLVGAGVVVSIGHSLATADEARAALDAGATMGTHLLNAMPPITARDPGLAGVLLTDRRAWFGVIADGHHLDPATLALAWHVAPDRFIAVTDAIAATGMPDGTYRIGSVDIAVHDGVARNAEGALAGASVTLCEELVVLQESAGIGFGDAIAAVTANPAAALGRDDLGRVAPGARGDLTLFDGDTVAATVVAGRIEYLRDPHRVSGQRDTTPPGNVIG